MQRRDHTGLEALTAACRVVGGTARTERPLVPWEAGDLCWWWRAARETDAVAQPTWWVDGHPVAAVRLTAWREMLAVDVLRRPDVDVGPDVGELAEHAAVLVAGRGSSSVTVLVDEDGHDVDPPLAAALRAVGWDAVGERTAVGWLAGAPRLRALPEGLRFASVADGVMATSDHLARRSGDEARGRLARTPLHDPALELCVLDGAAVVAYALGWADPSAGVGLVEPVRVEDEWQRRGVATAVVGELARRLRSRDLEAVRIGWIDGHEAAERTYLGVGFERRGTIVELRREAAHGA